MANTTQEGVASLIHCSHSLCVLYSRQDLLVFLSVFWSSGALNPGAHSECADLWWNRFADGF